MVELAIGVGILVLIFAGGGKIMKVWLASANEKLKVSVLEAEPELQDRKLAVQNKFDDFREKNGGKLILADDLLNELGYK